MLKRILTAALAALGISAGADVKISQLPLHSDPTTIQTADSFPFVNTTGTPITERFRLSDIPATPAFVTKFGLYAPLAGATFSGTVTAPSFVGPLTGNASTATALSTAGTTTTVLHGNASGAPTYGSVVGADLGITFSSPLSISVNTVSIQNAAADGATKGAAAFTASDFNASSGVISLDYANGQAASASVNGFLSSTDWSTFDAKQAAGNYITALTSDVSASGPGSASATVNSIGGSSASNVHSAELAANAATSANTASVIVKRDSSSNINVNTVNANGLTASQAVVTDGSKNLASLGYSTTATASNLLERDSNANVQFNNEAPNFATQATANSTLTLTIASAHHEFFTGSVSGQIVKLPAANGAGVNNGLEYHFVNLSSATVALQDNGGNALQTMAASSFAYVTLRDNSTANGSWGIDYAVNNAGGGTVTSVAVTAAGGIFSVSGSPITTTGTIAHSVAGTSGGIPYFSNGTTLTSSGALTNHGVVIGGGAGASPTSTSAGTATYVLTSNGASADPTFQLAPGRYIQTTVFTSNGTYNKNTNATWVRIVVVGSGGAGGGLTTSTFKCGSGGSGAATAIKWLANTSVGTTESITVGAAVTGGTGNGGNGNQSSFGSTVSANGGTGGAGSATSSGQGTMGSSTCSGADVCIAGGPGGPCIASSSGSFAFSGSGGGTPFGGGAAGEAGNAGNANNATGYGGGGAGGVTAGSSQQANGGSSTSGIVIVEEYQ